MRWQVTGIKVGARRVRDGFLLLPRTIGGEARWLERATWGEEYTSGYEWLGWEPICWLDGDAAGWLDW